MGSKGIVFKGILVLTAAAGLGGLAFLGVFSGKAMLLSQSTPLEVFCAPSKVPAGESWVLLASLDDLPRDLVAAPEADGVLVVASQRLSPKALALKVNVGEGIQGKLIRVSSQGANSAVVPELSLGQPPQSLAVDANIKGSDLVDGRLVVGGDFFIYGYFPRDGVTLSALRIHNRATGAWHSHEFALERAAQEAIEAIPPSDDPNFVAVEVLETLPDTNGDGIYDFEEMPEERPPVPEQLGVGLLPGLNVIDIVALDEAGNASWRMLEVYTSYLPERM